MAMSWTKAADPDFLPAEGSESDDDAREQQSKAQATGAPGGRWARQAAYRQRKAAKQAELAAQAEATRVAIEAAQNERASLHAEHAALQAAQLYQEQLLGAVRQAAAAGAVEQQIRQQLLAELEAEQRHEAGSMWAPAAKGPQIVSVPASDSAALITADGSGDRDKGPSKSSSSGDGGATSQPMSDCTTTPSAAEQAAAGGGDGRCASTGAAAPGPAAAGCGGGATAGAAPLPAHRGVHGSSAHRQAWNAASAVQESEAAATAGLPGLHVETPTTAAAAAAEMPQPCASSASAFPLQPTDSIPSGTLRRLQREGQQALSMLTLEGIMNGTIVPNDTLIRVMTWAAGEDLMARELNFRRVLQELITQYDRDPGSREVVRARVTRLQAFRFRVIKRMAISRWELLTAKVIANLLPPLQPGSTEPQPPSPQAEAVLRALACDVRMVERIRPLYELYCQRREAVRRQGEQQLQALQAAAAGSVGAWCAAPDASLASLMAAYPGVVEAAGGMQQWVRLESLSLLDLALSLLEITDPILMCRFSAAFNPYIVDPVLICEWVLRHSEAAKQGAQLGEPGHLLSPAPGAD